MAHITIENIDPSITYTVGGSARDEFPVPFAYFDDSDLVVTIDDEVQVLGTDYTVDGEDVDGGFESGTVTLTDTVTNVTVTIERDTPIERTTDFPNSGPFNVTAFNTQMDKVVAWCQQLKLGIDAVGQRLTDWIALISTSLTGDVVTVNFATRGAAVIATISDAALYLRTAGYYEAGDGGAALYRKADSQPSHAGRFQSADGAWWELAEDEASVLMFGALGDDDEASKTTNDAAFGDMLDYALATLKGCFVPEGDYVVSQIHIPGGTLPGFGTRVRLRGAGYSTKIKQATDSLTMDVIKVGSGTVNDTADCVIENLSIEAKAAKTAGAGIYAYGSSRLTIRDIYMQDNRMWDCIDLDGIDNHIISNVVALTPGRDFIRIYRSASTSGSNIRIDQHCRAQGVGRDGIVIGGGVGGVFVDCYMSVAGRHCLFTTTELDDGGSDNAGQGRETGYNVRNREINFGPSWVGEGSADDCAKFGEASIQEIVAVPGAYFNTATGGGNSIHIEYQGPPVVAGPGSENGALAHLPGVILIQSVGGILYKDTGTLCLDGAVIYNHSSNGVVLSPQTTGLARISMNGVKIIDNAGSAVVQTESPLDGVCVGSILTGNGSASVNWGISDSDWVIENNRT